MSPRLTCASMSPWPAAFRNQGEKISIPDDEQVPRRRTGMIWAGQIASNGTLSGAASLMDCQRAERSATARHQNGRWSGTAGRNQRNRACGIWERESRPDERHLEYWRRAELLMVADEAL